MSPNFDAIFIVIRVLVAIAVISVIYFFINWLWIAPNNIQEAYERGQKDCLNGKQMFEVKDTTIKVIKHK